MYRGKGETAFADLHEIFLNYKIHVQVTVFNVKMTLERVDIVLVSR